MASGNFTTGSLTPSTAQLAACGSTSNVVSGGHQFEGREKMMEETEYQKVQKAIWLLTRAMAGFEESNLYEDYKEYEGFTDEQWADAWDTLEKFAGKEPKKAPA